MKDRLKLLKAMSKQWWLGEIFKIVSMILALILCLRLVLTGNVIITLFLYCMGFGFIYGILAFFLLFIGDKIKKI